MRHFFTEPANIQEHGIYMDGPDVNHMKNVLRMKPGEMVGGSDGGGHEYICRISKYDGERVLLDIESVSQRETELKSRIYLFQGLPKGDKMEWIVQKAVELGVYQIIPVATRRCVVRLDQKKAEKKTERWNAIALSAAKQSGRKAVPLVKPVMSFQEAVDYAGDMDVVLIPYEMAEGMEKTRRIIQGLEPGQSVAVFIGPEGGFEDEEVGAAVSRGAEAVTLGRRILRTETAGLAVLSVLMYHLES